MPRMEGMQTKLLGWKERNIVVDERRPPDDPDFGIAPGRVVNRDKSNEQSNKHLRVDKELKNHSFASRGDHTWTQRKQNSDFIFTSRPATRAISIVVPWLSFIANLASFAGQEV